jgi:hypothetical protein
VDALPRSLRSRSGHGAVRYRAIAVAAFVLALVIALAGVSIAPRGRSDRLAPFRWQPAHERFM